MILKIKKEDILKDLTNSGNQVQFYPLYDPVNPVKGEVRSTSFDNFQPPQMIDSSDNTHLSKN